MKTDTRVMDVTSTLDGERVGMTIDEGALAHIMSVLTDLYSDPEMAVIREYSTNALDSHIEAGQTRPIEISLPSNLAPFFRVRDFGIGLDAEDIRNIYSRYGASSKRDSNDVVGMLGLGCKSALTYTDQFTLTGIKDGIGTQVSISRDEDGGGSMIIVAEYETDDPNGVEVIIPAKMYNKFEQKAHDFFRFWEEGTVLVNGEAPTRIGGMWLTDDLLMTKEASTGYGYGTIVMGNVPYSLPYEHSEGLFNLVAFVEIGAVNFTPSRESLQMTTKTKETLKVIRERFNSEKEAAFVRHVNEAPNKPAALKALYDGRELGFDPKMKMKYKGVEIPTDFETFPDHPVISVQGKKYHGDKGWGVTRRLYGPSLSKTIWLTGYDVDTFSPHKRKKLVQWLTEKKLDTPELFILCKDVPASVIEWIDHSTVHPWAEVAAQKIEVNRTNLNTYGAPSGSYEGWVDGVKNNAIEAKDIDTLKPVFFVRADRFYSWSNEAALVHDTFPRGSTVVKMGNNRVNKFKRDFPKAKDLKEHCKEIAAKWLKSLTEQQILSIRLNESRYDLQLPAGLDSSEVDDPEVAKLINVINSKADGTIRQYDLYSGRGWIDINNRLWDNPLKKYPLLTFLSGSYRMDKSAKNDLYLYLNAAFAANKEDN